MWVRCSRWGGEENNATRTCRVGNRVVCLWRSSFRIYTKYVIDSRPNLYLLRSCSSVSWSRSISRCWNFLPRICGSIKRNNKSAILFVLTNSRWVKFNMQFIPPFCLFWQTLGGLNLTCSLFLDLYLIVLLGTESNRGIKFMSRLAIFNSGLAIIGFPGTGAYNTLTLLCSL